MIQPYDCIDEDDAFVGFGTEGITLYDSLSLLYFRSLERIFFLVEFFYDDVRSFFFLNFPSVSVIFSTNMREREKITFSTNMN